MKIRYIKTGLIVLTLAASFSCSRKNIDLVNPNGLVPEEYNKNTNELTKSVNAIYAVQQAPALVGRRWYELHEWRGTDSKSGGPQLESAEAEILNGTLNGSNAILGEVWPTFYALILRANTVINMAPSIPGEDELKNRLVAEAKFLRAWSYFELATLWGPVPLYKKPAITIEEVTSRTSVEEVYNFVIQDLKEAQEALPASYDGANIGRATKGAAQSLLGMVYMQQLDYTNASIEFKKVIEANIYSLMDNYRDNFLEETEYNKESIYEVGFQYTNNNYGWGNHTGDGLLNVGESTMRNQDFGIFWRNYIPSEWIMNEYENTLAGDPKTDPRLLDNVYFPGDLFNNGNDTITSGNQTGTSTKYHGQDVKVSWKKYTLLYKNAEGYYAGGNNHRLIRYGMVLLNMAECEAALGNTAEAIRYLNMLRNRPSVKMPEYPTTKFLCATPEETFDAVMHEKAVETASEQVRNFDILRWRKAGRFKGKDPLPYYNPNYDLLPIPQQEMANNPNIGFQNPGY